MATAVIDGIATRYEVVGSGPPLLMYAPGGFNAIIENWSTQGGYADPAGRQQRKALRPDRCALRQFGPGLFLFPPPAIAGSLRQSPGRAETDGRVRSTRISVGGTTGKPSVQPFE